jgi:hypothetical protein
MAHPDTPDNKTNFLNKINANPKFIQFQQYLKNQPGFFQPYKSPGEFVQESFKVAITYPVITAVVAAFAAIISAIAAIA